MMRLPKLQRGKIISIPHPYDAKAMKTQLDNLINSIKWGRNMFFNIALYGSEDVKKNLEWGKNIIEKVMQNSDLEYYIVDFDNHQTFKNYDIWTLFILVQKFSHFQSGRISVTDHTQCEQ